MRDDGPGELFLHVHPGEEHRLGQREPRRGDRSAGQVELEADFLVPHRGVYGQIARTHRIAQRQRQLHALLSAVEEHGLPHAGIRHILEGRVRLPPEERLVRGVHEQIGLDHPLPALVSDDDSSNEVACRDEPQGIRVQKKLNPRLGDEPVEQQFEDWRADSVVTQPAASLKLRPKARDERRFARGQFALKGRGRLPRERGAPLDDEHLLAFRR